MAPKPRVFVGSSVEGISIASAIHENLKHNAEVTPWNQGAFELSQTTIESLIRLLDTSDYGIFVFSRDDVVNLKGKRYSAVRDNVLFELGLFIGRLGRERTFVIIPDDAESAKEIKLRIPTDLVGITLGTFENSRSDGNLVAATGAFSASVKSAMSRLGKIRPDEANESVDDNKLEPNTHSEIEKGEASIGSEEDWLILLAEKKYSAALSSINNMLLEERDPEETTNLTLGRIHCLLHIDNKQGHKELQEFYDKNVNSPELVSMAINMYIENHYHTKALELIEIELEKRPNEPQLIISKANALDGLGNLQESISLLESNSDNLKVALKLVSVLNAEEEYERAFDILHHAYIKYPDSEDVMYRFVQFANESKNSKRDDEIALFIADKLVKKKPENGFYLMYFGFSCLNLDLPDIALRYYKKAENVLKEPWVYSNLGSVFRLQGLYDEAKPYFQKAIAAKGGDAYSFPHTKMSEILNSQDEDAKKLRNFIKNGKLKASTITPPES